MTPKPTPQPILRQDSEVPKLTTNPASGLIADTIEHYGLTQYKVAEAMNVTPSLLSDIIRGQKRISVDTALRLEACLGLQADYLVKLQGYFDYCKAYHQKGETFKKEISRLVPV